MATRESRSLQLFGRTLEIPPELEREDVQAAAEELGRLYTDRQGEGRSLDGLTARRDGAVQADRDAFAAALREGNDDPGEAATEKIDAELKATRRRFEALDQALVAAWGEFEALVESHREAWAAELVERVADRRRRLARAIEKLAEAHAALADASARHAWIEGFPESRWLPARHGRAVVGLDRPSGEPLSWPQLLEVLRRQVES